MIFREAHRNLKKCTEIKYTLTPHSVECVRYVQITTIQTAQVIKTLLFITGIPYSFFVVL
jgi:hypothetical protein